MANVGGEGGISDWRRRQMVAEAQMRTKGASGWSGSRAVWSGRLPFVPVMKPANLRDGHHTTVGRCGDWARDRCVLIQRQVRA